MDIALDPFPCHGHTTSMDGFWMGVPVVSLAGHCPIARAGLSLLSNLNMEEWVAFSAEDYIGIACSAAGDRVRLSELRKTLRSRLEASLVMNAGNFARSIETVYRNAWRQWRRRTKSPCQ
jgi:predicted O-linked N-acetylglucosamine transferase (SPINDLY family)